jgi:flagellar motility protein MotE (MotC chaperone)
LKGNKTFIKKLDEEKGDLEEIQIKVNDFERNYKNDKLIKLFLSMSNKNSANNKNHTP